MLLTVNEIAMRLEKGKRERAALVERIRHWTREGLITPEGEKNPGTGRHRQYRENVLADVALLNVLAQTGIQVSSLNAILRYVEKAKSQTSGHSKEDRDHFICIRLGGGKGNYGGFFVPTDSQEIAVPKSLCGDAAIIINISQIARKSVNVIEE
jgi:DNA-binding transcriptional MerR regulator